MTGRDAQNAGSSGGMTGATGDLTPDEIPDDLVPGERREIENGPHPSSPDPTTVDTARESEPRAGGDEVSDEEERF